VQLAFVITFKMVHLKGKLGTLFVAQIPKITAEIGYVTNLNMTLGRRYMWGGRERSFLSARCATPPGVPGAIFILARGTFTFSNKQRITTAVARNCWVR
jgi:hypothetical protein